MKRRKESQRGDVYSFMYRMVREGFSNKMTLRTNKSCGFLEKG